MRDNKLTFYVEDETKAELEARADDADQSISTYLRDMTLGHLRREAQDELASEVRAEERIQELISTGVERMERTAEQMADMQAKAGVYAAANFELMKTDHKDAQRRDALSTGARRLRQDVDAVHAELDDTAETATADGDATDDEKGYFEELREDE
jgi:hypothetical protein